MCRSTAVSSSTSIAVWLRINNSMSAKYGLHTLAYLIISSSGTRRQSLMVTSRQSESARSP